MRQSQLFHQTLRDAPADADAPSHRFLMQGGFAHPFGAGLYGFLPLGWRVLERLSAILRSEMDAVGAQELALPVVQSADLWERSGRLSLVGPDLMRLRDRAGRALVLAMTHEEAVTAVAARLIRSYRQLPLAVYQLQTKVRDEPRPRAGLLRTREFVMKDAYSFHADAASLEATYEAMFAAYERIFERVGLDAVAVESDGGVMGGSGAHEFMVLSEHGEDTLLLCPAGDYRANRQVARFAKPAVPAEPLRPLEDVATPGTDTIAALARYLGVPESRTAKAVFFLGTGETGEERLIFAVLRGDMELSEAKLAAALGLRGLHPATGAEIRACGAEPGYASPVGIQRDGVTVVLDDAATAPNLVAGANRPGWHLRNVSAGRDYQPDVVADIAAARAGDACPRCGRPMTLARGVEVGNIFKLGTRYSEALGATFLDARGRPQPLVMGSYGIGLGRLMAAVVEAHHDAQGIRWPRAVAPYGVHLLALPDQRAPEVAATAERLYREWRAAGLDTLYDDRDESPGVKFADADLLGLPVQVAVGRRGLARGGVDVKRRATGERLELPLAGLLDWLKAT